MQYKKILSLIRLNPDGITLTTKGLGYLPNKGYFIALSDNKVKKLTLASLEKLSKTAKNLNLDAFYFGAWRDEKTGYYYIDLTIFAEEKQAATILAKIFNQKAIFDCQHLKTLYIN